MSCFNNNHDPPLKLEASKLKVHLGNGKEVGCIDKVGHEDLPAVQSRWEATAVEEDTELLTDPVMTKEKK